MVTYDITQIRSFFNKERWIADIKENAKTDTILMLVGNKSDLKHLRTVEKDAAEEFAAENNMMFIETSALESTNVERAFKEVIHRLHQKMIAERKSYPDSDFVDISKSVVDETSVKSDKCCSV